MMTNTEVIKQAEKNIRDTQSELKNLIAFAETVQRAIDQFIENKYAPLNKAIAKYGDGKSFESVHEAYGYGCIGKKKFEQLYDLNIQREYDPTSRLTKYILEVIHNREKELQNHLEQQQNLKADAEKRREIYGD